MAGVTKRAADWHIQTLMRLMAMPDVNPLQGCTRRRVPIERCRDNGYCASIPASASRIGVLGMANRPVYGVLKSRMTNMTLLSDSAHSNIVMPVTLLIGATRPKQANMIISQITNI